MGTLERVLQAAVITAALATIPLIILQEQGIDDPRVAFGDWAVWSVFLLEFVVMEALSSDRWRYARRNWLHIAVIVLSFPSAPAILSVVRLARLTRAARLARLVSVLWRGCAALRPILGRRGLLYVAALACAIMVTGGGLMSVLEPETVHGDFWAGLWWAAVTATTVGYGDISPATPWGRIVAIALMLSGIGLTSTLAASVAAYFVGQDGKDELKEIAERLARVEALLERQAGAVPPSRDGKAAEPATYRR